MFDFNRFKFKEQIDSIDCGAACLYMISKFYGRNISYNLVRELIFTDRQGASLGSISNAAEKIGFRTLASKVDIKTLIEDAPLPCILHWKQEHYVVLFGYENSKDSIKFWIADPSHGKVKINQSELEYCWTNDNNQSSKKGVVMLFEKSSNFQNFKNDILEKSKIHSFDFFLNYLKPFSLFFVQIFIGLIVVTIFQFLYPFLTQSSVDIGIKQSNLSFVNIILIATLILYLSQLLLEIVRSRILLHISTRINISLVSDFLIKLLQLPISFFDSKVIGDLFQRVIDQNKITQFMTNSGLSVIFSLLNVIVFGIVLFFYSKLVFLVYLLGTFVYSIWIIFFLKIRKKIEYKKFTQSSSSTSNIFQLFQGIQEIKLQNAESRFRWKWETIRAKGYYLEIKSLSITNIQTIGSSFINQTKNLFITFIASRLVITGEISLGMMLSIQYIIGQLNAPISQLLTFIQQLQEASISLERLNEIHQKDSEDSGVSETNQTGIRAENFLIPISFSYILFDSVCFHYGSIDSPQILKNLNFKIPFGKTTAIVGSSGSGKTTLLKLLMKFYEPNKGSIKIGNTDLKNIKNYDWREYFGAVLQDGFIFSDTIARNVAVKDDNIDKLKLLQAVKIANVEEYIEALPLGFNTKIGQDGIGVSMGQRQRLLIARAVYKEPNLILFDEATNSLDANNEKIIVNNMNEFLKNKTAVIVAHRLSTVKDADNIIVLDKGEIIEQGTHEELTALRGAYYTLIKNQLELGN